MTFHYHSYVFAFVIEEISNDNFKLTHVNFRNGLIVCDKLTKTSLRERSVNMQT
jgi:hypothetical protein